ncbi:uncharacterized protein LOC126317478 [Schistocerca gregaria]|uniref:uncharacterized protein LOC126317478 n=1 Tax=Schistocerca gregaria TaxID=7010 RepID=UPI00211E3988|nr:uncharacterized protein LOC126317478 [Schistocerca gregaria]
MQSIDHCRFQIGYVLDAIHWRERHFFIVNPKPVNSVTGLDAADYPKQNDVFCFECAIYSLSNSNELNVSKNNLLLQANQILAHNSEVLKMFFIDTDVTISLLRYAIDGLCTLTDPIQIDRLFELLQHIKAVILDSFLIKPALNILTSQLRSRPWQACTHILVLLGKWLEPLNAAQCKVIRQAPEYMPGVEIISYLQQEHLPSILYLVNDVYYLSNEGVRALIMYILCQIRYAPPEPQLMTYFASLVEQLSSSELIDLQINLLSHILSLVKTFRICTQDLIHVLNMKLLSEDINVKLLTLQIVLQEIDFGEGECQMLIEDTCVEFLVELLASLRYEPISDVTRMVTQCIIALSMLEYKFIERACLISGDLFSSFLNLHIREDIEMWKVVIPFLKSILQIPAFAASLDVDVFCNAVDQFFGPIVHENEIRNVAADLIACYVSNNSVLRDDISKIFDLSASFKLFDNIDLNSNGILAVIIAFLPFSIVEYQFLITFTITPLFLGGVPKLSYDEVAAEQFVFLFISYLRELTRSSKFELQIEWVEQSLKMHLLSSLLTLHSCFGVSSKASGLIRTLIVEVLSILDSSYMVDQHWDAWESALLSRTDSAASSFSMATTATPLDFDKSLSFLCVGAKSAPPGVQTTIIDLLYWATMYEDYQVLSITSGGDSRKGLKRAVLSLNVLSLDTKSLLRLAYMWAASYDPRLESLEQANQFLVDAMSRVRVGVILTLSPSYPCVQRSVIPQELLTWIWNHSNGGLEELSLMEMSMFINGIRAEDVKYLNWIHNVASSSAAIRLLVTALRSTGSQKAASVGLTTTQVLYCISRLIGYSSSVVLPSLLTHLFPIIMRSLDFDDMLLHAQIVTKLLLYEYLYQKESSNKISAPRIYKKYLPCLECWLYAQEDVQKSVREPEMRLALINFLNALVYINGKEARRILSRPAVSKLVLNCLHSSVDRSGGSCLSASRGAAILFIYQLLQYSSPSEDKAVDSESKLLQAIYMMQEPNPMVSLVGIQFVSVLRFHPGAAWKLHFNLVCGVLLQFFREGDRILSYESMWQFLQLCSRVQPELAQEMLTLPHHVSILGSLGSSQRFPENEPYTLPQVLYMTTLYGTCARLNLGHIPKQMFEVLTSEAHLERMALTLATTDDANIFALLTISLHHASSSGMLSPAHKGANASSYRSVLGALERVLKKAQTEHPKVAPAPNYRVPIDAGGVLVFPGHVYPNFDRIHEIPIGERVRRLLQWLEVINRQFEQ